MPRRFSAERFLTILWMIGVGVMFLWPSWVPAATCSGDNCACGDTLIANYTMRGHFHCPAQNGIRIGAGVTLDCNHWHITGTPTASNFGIGFAGNNGRALECHVGGFKVGIRTHGFDGIHIRGMPASTLGASYNNGDGMPGSYGIYIEPGSCRYLISRMVIYDNTGEGIRNAADCSDTTYGTIEDNVVRDNTKEGLYFTDADLSALVTRNQVLRNAGPAVRLKNSSQNSFDNNFIDGTFLIEENSDLNYLERNSIENGILRLRGLGTSRPDGNDLVLWSLAGSRVVYSLDNPGLNNSCEDCTFKGGTPDGQCVNFDVSPGTNLVIRPHGGATLGTNDTGPAGNRCITVIP